MAQIYYPKKMSTKLAEGAVAGLIGGLVVAVIMIITDAILRPGHAWWYTPSLIGSLAMGTPESNVASLNASFLVGSLIHFVLFALIGMGFVNYKALLQAFRVPVWVGGAIYGAIIWLSVFFLLLNAIKPAIPNMVNNVALFIACVLGGAAIGWWLSRPEPRRTS